MFEFFIIIFCVLIGFIYNFAHAISGADEYGNNKFEIFLSNLNKLFKDFQNDGSEPESEPEKPEQPIIFRHMEIIKDAEDEIAIIKGAANVASGSLGENLRAILFNIINIENGLIKEPLQLSNVQRIFTYYIPAIIDLLNARGVAVNNNDEKRIIEIDAMVRKTKIVFDDYLLRLNGQDKKSVDIDLKLLEQSLAQEFTHIDINKLKS